MPANTRLEYLLDRFFNRTNTDEERKELLRIIYEAKQDATLKEYMDQCWERLSSKHELNNEQSENILSKILQEERNADDVQVKRKIFTLTRVAAAAVLLFLAGGAYWFLTRTPKQIEVVKTPELTNDVKAPETSLAMITLANGQKVYLDSAANGTLAMQGGIQVTKLADGQITYSGGSNEVMYNTLSNSRGSKVVAITLADGSKVWLNSESSLTYPTVFIGGERKVEITGEAYFEVAKDVSKKFIVSSNGAFTEVLGTHFNINSYKDESSLKVTLLEGSVRITNAANSQLLVPSQQAQINANGTIVVNRGVDIEQVMAWKNGEFQFGDKADIATIMKQISRWYNIEVEYTDTIKGHIGGSISRDVNVSQVLKMLEKTGGMNFKIEGNKVTVMP